MLETSMTSTSVNTPVSMLSSKRTMQFQGSRENTTVFMFHSKRKVSMFPATPVSILHRNSPLPGLHSKDTTFNTQNKVASFNAP